MNFLAHIFLSGDNKNVALGNLIGDMVKGRAYENYEAEIKTGLLLHRAIDEYTDKHPLFLHSKELIKPYFRRYAGVVTDIYYDYFLAKNWEKYKQSELQSYVNEIYILLIKKYRILPARAQRIVPIMIIRNWLGSYGNQARLHQIFLGMHRRTLQRGDMHRAVEILNKHHEKLEEDFTSF